MPRFTIVVETHATSLDNEAGVASGHADVALSRSAGSRPRSSARHREDGVAAFVCSDLRRAWETAELAFGGRAIPTVRNPRLREPFPDGESYEQAIARVKSFLDGLPAHWAGRRVVVIGHRATLYGPEHRLNDVPLAQAIAAPWSWHPGWTYEPTVTSSG